MLHLAVLIANPRQEIPAADLVAGAGVALAGRAEAGGRVSRCWTPRRSPSTAAGSAAWTPSSTS